MLEVGTVLLTACASRFQFPGDFQLEHRAEISSDDDKYSTTMLIRAAPKVAFSVLE